MGKPQDKQITHIGFDAIDHKLYIDYNNGERMIISNAYLHDLTINTRYSMQTANLTIQGCDITCLPNYWNNII